MINIRKLEAELWDKVLNGKTVASLEDALQKQKTEAKQLIADAPRKDKSASRLSRMCSLQRYMPSWQS